MLFLFCVIGQITEYSNLLFVYDTEFVVGLSNGEEYFYLWAFTYAIFKSIYVI
jgi:hypothetical protein